MKKFFLAISIFLFILIVSYLALFTFINTRGREILAERVESELGIRPEIESVSLKFPLTLKINNFCLGDLFFAYGEVSLGSFNPFTSALGIKYLYLEGLDLTVVRQESGISIDPVYSPQSFLESPLAKDQEFSKEKLDVSEKKTHKHKEEVVKRDLAVKIGEFYLDQATIRYIDKSNQQPLELVLFNVRAQVKDFYYPQLTEFSLEIFSSLKVQDQILEDLLVASGWVDYANLSMDVDLKVSSFPYVSFSQYYPSFWQAENLGVKKAFLSLDSSLKAEDNDLVIDATLILDELKFIDLSGEDSLRLSRQRLVRTITSLLKGQDRKPRVRIRLKTKMDSPEITASVIGDSFRQAVPMDLRMITGQIIDRASSVVKDSPGKIKKIPKDTLERTLDIFRDTVGTIKDIFTGVD